MKIDLQTPAAWLATLVRSLGILSIAAGLAACTPPAQPPPTAAPTAAPTSAPPPVSAAKLQALATLDQLLQAELPHRDPVQLVAELHPPPADAPASAPPTQTSATYQTGDTVQFWVHNSDARKNIRIEARLVYQSAVANVWVEEGQPYDSRPLRRSIDRFTDNIYPALVAAFGSEANPGVDNDPRLHVLHATQLGSGIAGYFYSADKYPTTVNPFSNQKEIFFINLSWLNQLRDYTPYETVLAHEFQHMIHWNQDRGEDLWLNEGLSEYAQELAGYAPDVNFATLFLADPDLPLTAWSATPGASAPHYGASYLWVAYLAQRFGDNFLRTLVAEQANGAAGIGRALAQHTVETPFDTLFADWVVANWVDDPAALAADGRYGYEAIELPERQAAAQQIHLPLSRTAGEVANYGTDYLAFRTPGDWTLHFAGTTTTRLAALPAGHSHLWWSNRGDDANSRLTRLFDLGALQPGQPVTLTVDSWWQIEEDYDYAYVQASSDRIHWQILAGQRTRTDNPTGNALGAGYTGSSAQGDAERWVREIYDLGAFAGGPLWLRFSYVTDDAVNTEGWFLDAVELPAIGFVDSFDGDVTGWLSEGWVLTENLLPQRWLVQLLEFENERLVRVTPVTVDAAGNGTVDLARMEETDHAVVAVSALTPVTTERATYRYWVEERSSRAP